MIEEFVAIFRCKRFLQDQISSLTAGFSLLSPGSLGPVIQEQMGFLPSQYPKIYEFLLTVVSLDSRKIATIQVSPRITLPNLLLFWSRLVFE